MKYLTKVLVTKNDPVSDYCVEDWYDYVLKTNDYPIKLSTETMLSRLRVGVIEGDLAPFFLELEWDEEVYHQVNDDGSVDNWKNLFGFNLQYAAKLGRRRRSKFVE